METVRQKSVRHYPQGVAGTCAGMVSTFALYPLDLLQVRYQVHNRKDGQQYNSIRGGMRTIISQSGARGLYQGLSPALLCSGVSVGLYFYLYDWLKDWTLSKSNKKESFDTHLICGLEAGMLTSVLTNPIWLVKTRLQLQGTEAGGLRHKPYSGVSNALITIYREEGPRALYRGMVPSLMLCSQTAIQLMVYEWLRSTLCESEGSGSLGSKSPNLNSMHFLAMGAVSKAFASVLTTPTQVVKARLQKRAASGESMGLMAVVKRLWISEGFRGFTKGAITNAVRVAPGSGVMFLTYETVLKAIQGSTDAATAKREDDLHKKSTHHLA